MPAEKRTVLDDRDKKELQEQIAKSGKVECWFGTRAEYNSLPTEEKFNKDFYFIEEGS